MKTALHTTVRPEVQFSFLDVAAEQRVSGRVVGVEILSAVGELNSYVAAELTHTPL
jgi:hypothetical protein